DDRATVAQHMQGAVGVDLPHGGVGPIGQTTGADVFGHGVCERVPVTVVGAQDRLAAGVGAIDDAIDLPADFRLLVNQQCLQVVARGAIGRCHARRAGADDDQIVCVNGGGGLRVH